MSSFEKEGGLVLFCFVSYCLLLMVLMLEARPERVMNTIPILALGTSRLLMVASVFMSVWKKESVGDVNRIMCLSVFVCVCLCECVLSFGVLFREVLHYQSASVVTIGGYRLVCSQ